MATAPTPIHTGSKMMERDDNETETTDQQEDTGKNGHSPPVQVNITSATSDVAEKSEQKETNDQSRAVAASGKASRAIIWFTGALVIVGAVGVGIAYLQWRTLEKTEQVSRNINRAFVYAGKINLQRDVKDPVFGVAVPITNSGNTPTSNLAVQIECVTAPPSAAVPEPFSTFTWDKKKAKPQVLGPKQSIILFACILTQNQYNKIRDRKANQFIIGEARYFDILTHSKMRRTRFVQQLFIDPNRQYSSRPIGKNNCSDEDCP